MNKTLLFAFLLMGGVSLYAQTSDDLANLGLTTTQKHVSFEKRQMILTNSVSGKTKKLKEGALARMKIKGDTAFVDIIIEAFLTDSIIVARLEHKQNGKKSHLQFSSFQVVPLSTIESIEYSIRHTRAGTWGVFLLTTIGIEAVVFPLVIPPLMGDAEEAYSQPHFPFIIAGGVAMFVGGRLLHKSMKPKEYRLSEWKYESVKK